MDTIDDRNLVGSVGGVTFGGNLTQSPFGAEFLCSHDDFVPLAASTGGVKVVHGDADDCNEITDECMILDRMSEVIWTSLEPTGVTSLTQGEAQKACSDLSMGGYNDWRLPDQNELIQAMVNAIGSIETRYEGFKSTDNTLWSSTSRSNVTTGWQGIKDAWYINLYSGAADYDSKTDLSRKFRCVRGA